eukprot:scaffold74523_cov70-Phaeocystis_antarctica.AAC.1
MLRQPRLVRRPIDRQAGRRELRQTGKQPGSQLASQAILADTRAWVAHYGPLQTPPAPQGEGGARARPLRLLRARMAALGGSIRLHSQ